MSRMHFALCVLSLALAACKSEPKKPAMTMADWMTPGEAHQQLVKGVGYWEGTLTMFGEHATPQPIHATETVEAVGPFWIQSRFTCDFMGQPYVGTGCVGYDPAKKKYVGTWIDSMSSYFSKMEGQKDANGVLVLHWTAPDETTGKMVSHRSESVETAGTRVMTFFQGKNPGTKTMVIQMKRR